MSNLYRITITMSMSTLAQLRQDGFILYGFKAVEAGLTGVPLVWFQTTAFASTTVLSWMESYEAYTSRDTQIKPGSQITVLASCGIRRGDELTVTSPQGTGTVDQGPNPHGVVIYNHTTATPFSCGISQRDLNDTYQPVCAFPLP